MDNPLMPMSYFLTWSFPKPSCQCKLARVSMCWWSCVSVPLANTPSISSPSCTCPPHPAAPATVENMQAINNKHLNLQQYSVHSLAAQEGNPFGATKLGESPFLFAPLPPPTGFAALPPRPSGIMRAALEKLAGQTPGKDQVLGAADYESKPEPTTTNPMHTHGQSPPMLKIDMPNGEEAATAPLKVSMRIRSSRSPRTRSPQTFEDTDNEAKSGSPPERKQGHQKDSAATTPASPAATITDRALSYQPCLPNDTTTQSLISHYHYPPPGDSISTATLRERNAQLVIHDEQLGKNSAEDVSVVPLQPASMEADEPVPAAWFDERAFDPIPLSSSKDLLKPPKASSKCCGRKQKEKSGTKPPPPSRAASWMDLHSNQPQRGKARAMQKRREKKKQELNRSPGVNHYEVNSMPFFAAGKWKL